MTPRLRPAIWSKARQRIGTRSDGGKRMARCRKGVRRDGVRRAVSGCKSEEEAEQETVLVEG